MKKETALRVARYIQDVGIEQAREDALKFDQYVGGVVSQIKMGEENSVAAIVDLDPLNKDKVIARFEDWAATLPE